MPSPPEPDLPGTLTGSPAQRPVEAPPPDAFDALLREELGRLHDEVLTQPVPEAMLRILRAPPSK